MQQSTLWWLKKKESHIEEALKMVLEGEQDLTQTGGPRVL